MNALKKINNRGISQVVAIAVLILLAIIAISALWVAVKPIVSLSPELSCTQLQLSEPQVLSIEKACYDSSGGEVVLTLSRSLSSINDKTLDFSLAFEDGKINKYRCGEGCEGSSVLNRGETKKYFFAVDETPMQASISVNSCSLETSDIEPSC